MSLCVGVPFGPASDAASRPDVEHVLPGHKGIAAYHRQGRGRTGVVSRAGGHPHTGTRPTDAEIRTMSRTLDGIAVE